MKGVFCALVAMGAVLAGGNEVQAQENGARSVAVMAGGLMYDFEGDQTKLMLSGSADWQITKHLIVELGSTWSRFDISRLDHTQNPVVSVPSTTQLFTGTVGVQGQLQLGRVRPYLGAATGVFVRYDAEGGDRFIRPSTSFPLGVRIDVLDRFGIRGELRARFDEHQSGASGINLEQTLGVSVRF
jgi:hypothetical protein